MRLLSSILFLITACCVSIAQQAVKYLPCKITTNSISYTFEYDSLGRIVEQKRIFPQSRDEKDTPFTDLRTYTYSLDSDNFSSRNNLFIEDTLDVDKGRINLSTDFYNFQKQDNIFVCDVKKEFYTDEKNTIVEDSKMYIYFNTEDLVNEKEQSRYNSKSNSIYKYNTESKLSKIEDTNTMMELTLKSTLEVIESQSGKKVFEDVNFSSVSKVVQLNNLFLILADQNPTKILVITDKTDQRKEENSGVELANIERTNIEYTYNDAGYPSSLKMTSSKTDKSAIFEIEYIKIEN